MTAEEASMQKANFVSIFAEGLLVLQPAVVMRLLMSVTIR